MPVIHSRTYRVAASSESPIWMDRQRAAEGGGVAGVAGRGGRRDAPQDGFRFHRVLPVPRGRQAWLVISPERNLWHCLGACEVWWQRDRLGDAVSRIQEWPVSRAGGQPRRSTCCAST